MDLPLLSALFAALSLGVYIMLDGFDLGVGALLLFQPRERLRNHMADSILPTWDGNETWLIMAAITLLAGFPLAYGVLIPGFYLPLIVMLLSLGLRGVSFEFRGQTETGRHFWDLALGIGSVTAALMQGLVVGGLIQGVRVDGDRFAGGVFDSLSPFSLLVAATLLVGYVVLGAGWLHLKGVGGLRRFAERALIVAVPVFGFAAACVCAWARAIQPGIEAEWTTRFGLLAAVTCLFILCLIILFRSIGGVRDGLPYALGLTLFALGLGGFGVAIFPGIIPFRVTLWDAAAAPASHVFVLVGAAMVAPMVIAYSAFAYSVFRGKTPAAGWNL